MASCKGCQVYAIALVEVCDILQMHSMSLTQPLVCATRVMVMTVCNCRVQLLSWQPRLQLHHNLLTADEADALLNLAKGQQQQQQQGSDGADVPEL